MLRTTKAKVGNELTHWMNPFYLVTTSFKKFDEIREIGMAHAGYLLSQNHEIVYNSQ